MDPAWILFCRDTFGRVTTIKNWGSELDPPHGPGNHVTPHRIPSQSIFLAAVNNLDIPFNKKTLSNFGTCPSYVLTSPLAFSWW